MVPLNRFLLVNVVEDEEKEKPSFYLPDDVVTNKKPYEVVEIIDVSSESKFASALDAGDKVVVEGHMLRSVVVFGEKATLIEDNYVLAKC
jgi:co-chaperonin GroES (HSP10)